MIWHAGAHSYQRETSDKILQSMKKHKKRQSVAASDFDSSIQ